MKILQMRICLILIILTTVILAGCATSAETRVKRYFDVKRSGEPSADEIKIAALKKITVGSAADAIYAYFAKLGIPDGFKDRSFWEERYSFYIRAWEKDSHRPRKDIVLYVTLAPGIIRLVYNEYAVIFEMSDEGRLVDVRVNCIRTGP